MKNSKENKDQKKPVTVPFLILKSLSGEQTNFTISNDKFIIGRLPDLNDIALQPDPQNLITRHMHCFVEIRNSTGWLVDNASKNGTFLKRDNTVQKINGEIKLQDNDCIMLLGEINEDNTVKYWELTFKDPFATKDVVNEQTTIIYNWVEAKLIVNYEGNRKEVCNLTPLEHKLLRYMDQKNKHNNNVPVMCTYDELISAIWDDIYSHTKNDVNHIVASLRKKIEKDPKNPVFLTNIRGLGYRFITNL